MSPTQQWRRRLDERLAELRSLKKQIKEQKAKLEQATADAAACEEAQQVAQAVAQTVQQQVHERIAGVVSKCLSCVFGDNETVERIEASESQIQKTHVPRILKVQSGNRWEFLEIYKEVRLDSKEGESTRRSLSIQNGRTPKEFHARKLSAEGFRRASA